MADSVMEIHFCKLPSNVAKIFVVSFGMLLLFNFVIEIHTLFPWPPESLLRFEFCEKLYSITCRCMTFVTFAQL